MEGVIKDIHFIQILSNRFQIQKKGEMVYYCRCPVCGDSKKKKRLKRFFFLKHHTQDKMAVYCHNCDYSTTFRQFIKDYAPDVLDEYNFFGFKQQQTITPKQPAKGDSVLESLQEKIKQKEEEKSQRMFITNKELFDNTKHFGELMVNHPARKRVDERLLPYDKIRYCSDLYELIVIFGDKEQKKALKYYNIPCIIIPYFQKDEQIQILQARFFDPKVSPKYLTVKFNQDALKIYNKDFVDQTKDIYVTEGPLDSMFVPNSVALGGSDGYCPFSDTIFVSDNEPHNKEINKKLERRIEKNERVVLWGSKFPFKDINEGFQKKVLTTSNIKSILQSRCFRGLKAKLEFTKYKRGE